MDYKNFSPNGPQDSTIIRKRWWELNETDLPGAIAGIVNHLHNAQSQRLTQLIMGTRLYGNISIMGLNGLSYSRMIQKQASVRDRLTYNVIQSSIDTVTSRISKNKPKPLFLTSGGDYRLQRKAKNLGKFVDGIFYENSVYQKAPMTFRNACIWGTGVTHVYNYHGRVRHEDVLPHELYVDEVEAYRGNPTQIHRIKCVDRMRLVDMFPSKKRSIMEVNPSTYDEVGEYQNISDVVTVRESFHLPSGPDAGDGLHVITINQDVLFKEEWKRDHFPYAFFHWNKRPIGFWGQSVVDQIQNIQLEINKLMWVLQRSYHLAGSFKVLLESGSKIVKEHLTNDVGAVINYTGTRPEYVVPPIVPVEYYTHLEGLIQKAFNEVGVSQLSANSQKPAGLNSGKALREYNDIESDRFTTVERDYEQYFIDLAKLDIETAKEIAEEEGHYKVHSFDRNKTIEVDWKDIDLQDDEYVMKIYPVSSLPDDPAGRLQTIQEYMQAGLMSPRTGRRLLDFPDLEQVEDLANAEEEWINECLEKILDCKEKDKDIFVYTAPEPEDDLQACLEIGQEYYARGKKSGVEEWKLELMRKWINDTKLLQGIQTTGMQQVAAQQAAQQAAQANPMPQPQSDLIQNAPGVVGMPQVA